MNARAAERLKRPLAFAGFSEWQEWLATVNGGEATDYPRDAARTLEVAQLHGVRAEVEDAMADSESEAVTPARALELKDVANDRSDATPVLELSDAAFLFAWADLSIEERSALPDEVRAQGFARYSKLRPDIAASVDRAVRAERTAASTEANEAAPIPGFHVSAIWDGYAAPPYLVKRMLGPHELTVLFGQSGHFKSVVAVDLALCVASGTEYHGMRTRRAGVLYVAGEGHVGIRKRVRAWALHHGLDAASEQPSLYITTSGADLVGNPLQLRATVDAASRALGVSVELVVIDTLAANFGNGDENHANEMQLAIANARRAAPAAAVLMVHHTGHGQVERERGSYALVAAADYRLQASYDDIGRVLELKWLKVKDDERPEAMAFEWKAVPLEWQDGDGEELSSVVLERSDGARAGTTGPRAVGLGKNQQLALKALASLVGKVRRNLDARGDDEQEVVILAAGWRAELEKQGMARARWHEVTRDLSERGLVAIDGPNVRLVRLTP